MSLHTNFWFFVFIFLKIVKSFSRIESSHSLSNQRCWIRFWSQNFKKVFLLSIFFNLSIFLRFPYKGETPPTKRDLCTLFPPLADWSAARGEGARALFVCIRSDRLVFESSLIESSRIITWITVIGKGKNLRCGEKINVWRKKLEISNFLKNQ